jgi:hypothetical protein
VTFAIVAANADQIIQVSDRRLTGWDKSIATEASGKAGHLLCDDASVLYCYTGLAFINGFKTAPWLMEALQAAARNDRRFRELVGHFAKIASKHFATNSDVLSVDARNRKLIVMLTGYMADGFIANVLISNFQDFENFVDHSVAQPEFTVHFEPSTNPASENPTIIQAVGTFSALTGADEEELREMLERRAPHSAIRAKAVAIVTEISDRHRSGGTVGKRLNTGRLDYASPLAATGGYVSDVVEHGVALLDMVDARSTGAGIMLSQLQITAGKPVVFPKVHRNAPCPCGSGKQYKFCHRGT